MDKANESHWVWNWSGRRYPDNYPKQFLHLPIALTCRKDIARYFTTKIIQFEDEQRLEKISWSWIGISKWYTCRFLMKKLHAFWCLQAGLVFDIRLWLWHSQLLPTITDTLGGQSSVIVVLFRDWGFEEAIGIWKFCGRVVRQS